MNLKEIIYTVLMSCVVIVIPTECKQINQVTKVFYHKGNDKVPAQIELANLVLYFNKEPSVKILSSKQLADGMKQVEFLLAQTNIDKDLLQKLQIVTNVHYALTTATTSAGMVITMRYNPAYVEITHETFTAITMDKALIFRIFNHDLLTKLQQKQSSLIQVASLTPMHKKKIMIDCGHGGQDHGAHGCLGLKEKDLVLSIGLELADLLRKHEYTVFLTRDCDCDLDLDERTSLANRFEADIFVSIHANYAANQEASGIETFCLAPLAAHSLCHGCLIEQILGDRSAQGYTLAQQIHNHVIIAARTHYEQVVDRHVKQAISQVLIGAQMPAVLVEVGFISHKREAACLCNMHYQHLVANGICNGIIAFLKS
jgi:N-acetylmuramoyl-L-alanine amidase